MRIVLDSNVVVSAFLWETSPASQAFDLAGTNGDLLTSLETIEELTEVLARSKFDRYAPREVRKRLLAGYIESSILIPITQKIRACRDPGDDKFLSLAISGKADLIITGDADLQMLNPFREVTIISPAEYLLR